MRNLKSPLVPSSFMTPRTIQLYAFGETASGELDKLPKLWGNNPAMGDKAQLLNF
jgi:hypothetical protein